jgi:hypothetical protein
MGSLVIIHDRSYMKEVSPDLCSAAVMIYCTSTSLLCKRTIAEKTASAVRYWGEILGATLAQLILHAAVQGRMGPYPVTAIDCDNLGMVRHGNKPQRPLSITQPQAEVPKILKQYIAHQPFASKFLYVASHADDIKLQKECSLKERINIKVDSLTKKALWYAHALEKYFDGRFPKEDFTINTNGKKVTGQIRPALEEYWGRATARTFRDQKILYHRRNLILSGGWVSRR